MKNILSFNEAVSLQSLKTYILDIGYLLTFNLAHITQEAVDSYAKNELEKMLNYLNKGIIINGKNFSKIIDNINELRNPKYASAVLLQVKKIIEYIEPRLKKYLRDGDRKQNILDIITKLKTRYITIINEGALSKATATIALGISALAPQKAHGQIGNKIKNFIKKETSMSKSNLPKVGEIKIVDNKELNNLSLDNYESFGNLPISKLPEGKYLITSAIAKTQAAGEMQSQQQLDRQNMKIGRIFNYYKNLNNGNLQIVSIAQLK